MRMRMRIGVKETRVIQIATENRDLVLLAHLCMPCKDLALLVSVVSTISSFVRLRTW